VGGINDNEDSPTDDHDETANNKSRSGHEHRGDSLNPTQKPVEVFVEMFQLEDGDLTTLPVDGVDESKLWEGAYDYIVTVIQAG
jgi:hypothetical protein